MDQRAFVKFYVLFGVSLLLIGNVSSLFSETYSRRIAAAEVLPLTVCEKNENGDYALLAEPASEFCDAISEELLQADCASLESQEKQSACAEMKTVVSYYEEACGEYPYDAESFIQPGPSLERALMDSCAAYGL